MLWGKQYKFAKIIRSCVENKWKQFTLLFTTSKPHQSFTLCNPLWLLVWHHVDLLHVGEKMCGLKNIKTVPGGRREKSTGAHHSHHRWVLKPVKSCTLACISKVSAYFFICQVWNASHLPGWHIHTLYCTTAICYGPVCGTSESSQRNLLTCCSCEKYGQFAHTHTSMQTHKKPNLELLHWPSHSPDLNPIEHAF